MLIHDIGLPHSEHFYALLFASLMMSMHQMVLKNRYDGFRIVVSSDPVNGQRITLHTVVDQHQLASRRKPVLVSTLFHGQSDRHHLPLTRGQAITCRIQIKVTRPQAVWAMVAVVHTGKQTHG
ncbi:MAG TPA: hypothetical protein VLA72_12245 [Anaerolineales bacterium]|nr:hypothetical protein [Anaerolineales bacterium]